MQCAGDTAHETLRLKLGLVAVEGHQVMQVESRARPPYELAVGVARRHIHVTPRTVRSDLIEIEVHPDVGHIGTIPVGPDHGDRRAGHIGSNCRLNELAQVAVTVAIAR